MSSLRNDNIRDEFAKNCIFVNGLQNWMVDTLFKFPKLPRALLRTSPSKVPETPWAQGGPQSDTRDLWRRW